MDLIRTEQKREMGELMKGFVDKPGFYETIKDREVARDMDEAALARLRSGASPLRDAR